MTLIKTFLGVLCPLTLIIASPFSFAETTPSPHVLMIVAHPDDEYFFAATVYRITHRLNGQVDQMVLTDGRDGYHYSTLAEPFYGIKLTDPKVAAEKLPSIRRQELEQSGKVLGIHEHFFENHPDQKCTSIDDTFKLWGGKDKIKFELKQKIVAGHYDFIFVQLPTPTNHEHHKTTALAALEVVNELPTEHRPVILAASVRMDGSSPADVQQDDPSDSRNFISDGKNDLTEVIPERLTTDRSIRYGFKNSLSDQMIVNWVVAAHKSQGLFQLYANKHRFEEFRIFRLNSEKATEKARQLFKNLLGSLPNH